MLSLRYVVLIAGLSLVAATLAIVAHDIRMAGQLARLLARAHHGEPEGIERGSEESRRIPRRR
jgi:hypothetical protein